MERGKVEKRGCDRGRKVLPKTKLILDYINDDQRLQEWGRYTCKERAELIQRELGVSVHPHVLRKLYLRLNIKFRPVKVEPLCKNYHTIHERRQQFALDLAANIDAGVPIVYIDETTFHYHMR